MFAFDRDVFFKDLPLRTGLAPKPAAKDGLTFLLDAFETDAGFTQIRDLAYVLATVRWETGQTFQPVKEKRASKDKNPRLWKIQMADVCREELRLGGDGSYRRVPRTRVRRLADRTPPPA